MGCDPPPPDRSGVFRLAGACRCMRARRSDRRAPIMDTHLLLANLSSYNFCSCYLSWHASGPMVPITQGARVSGSANGRAARKRESAETLSLCLDRSFRGTCCVGPASLLPSHLRDDRSCFQPPWYQPRPSHEGPRRCVVRDNTLKHRAHHQHA